jgi:formylglycine-generating enzyme required for sulfatase activity
MTGRFQTATKPDKLSERGYVQREMKLALDALQELPEGTIHTIPVRLDDCDVPEPFRRYHYANLFDPRGFERLTQAIHTGLTQRQHFTPQSALEPPPDPIPHRGRTVSGAEGRSVAETPVRPPQEPEPSIVSQSEVLRVSNQKSRQVSVVTIAGLVLAVISALAAVIVVPEVREWFELDKPPAKRETREPVSIPREITTGIGMEFVLIPAGEFQMGSNEGTKDERPVHRVHISESFFMGKYEVTQAQWEAVMGTNPSRFKGNPNRPVENVSWEDVQAFIKRLNRQEGWEVCRLPTEAQWEYAARAGTTTERYENDLGAIAWYNENSGGETHEVAQKRPNARGLYDMLGNVREWCHDGQRKYTSANVIDPIGLTDAGAGRVARGGSWQNDARSARAADRYRYSPGEPGGHNLGFRCSSSGPNK